jgi:hypothetical protein
MGVNDKFNTPVKCKIISTTTYNLNMLSKYLYPSFGVSKVSEYNGYFMVRIDQKCNLVAHDTFAAPFIQYKFHGYNPVVVQKKKWVCYSSYLI